MKISNAEKRFLMKKYRKEGLSEKQIYQRFMDLDFEQDMLKYNKRKERIIKPLEVKFRERFREIR